MAPFRFPWPLAAFVVVFGAGAADSVWLSDRGTFRLSYRSALEPLVINRIHSWTLRIEDAAGEPVAGAEIEVTGGMPAHDHGLPTQPRVTRDLGGGDYLLEGMRFHMGGEWEVVITVRDGDRADTVRVSLRL